MLLMRDNILPGVLPFLPVTLPIGLPDDWPTVPINHRLVGGAAFFSPYTVHRTYSRPSMDYARVSMDLRFYGPIR
jgi:hypothetical protein